MPVTVVTCPDGQRRTYTCTAREAAKCAWYQVIKRDYNTWNYDYSDVVRLPDGRYAYRGFVAQEAEGIIPNSSQVRESAASARGVGFDPRCGISRDYPGSD